MTERSRARGTPTLRLFGVLSAKDEAGAPICRYHASASNLARGGLSIPWELCEGRGREPCPYADECTARSGHDGPSDARVIVGTHALMAQLSGQAGATGLMVIDEPPDLLDDALISADDIRRALRDGEWRLEWRYFAALRPALDAIARWIETAELDKAGALSAALDRVDPALLEDATAATGETTASGAARAAFEEGHKGSAPPIQPSYISTAKGNQGEARKIGDLARVFRLLWQGLQNDTEARARIELVKGVRKLILTLPHPDLREVLKRDGAVVIADASGLHDVPIYERIVGYTPPVVEVYADDGCDVERTVLLARGSRRAFAPDPWETSPRELVRAVRQAVDWALEDPPERLAIVSYQVVTWALRVALGENVPEWEVDEAVKASTRKALGAELRRLPCRPDVGYFGGLRGLDHWKDHDALITLGDPWPQLTRTQFESQFLTLDFDRRMVEETELELEQAHGRLRTVHRQKPARSLHVGLQRPNGWPGDVRVLDDRGGQRSAFSAGQVRDAVQKLGLGGAARKLGLSKSTISERLKVKHTDHRSGTP